MKKTTLLIAGFLAAAVVAAVPASAAEQVKPPRESWSFAGPFGTFDRAQLQRGFKVYREVCASCHGLSRVAFRNLSQPGGPEFTEGQVKALAAEYQIQDGPNEAGDMFERPGRPADHFPSPFPNENAARAANGGAYPPDFSLLAKARTYERGFPLFIVDAIPFFEYAEHGVDYIHALLTGYREAPAGTTLQPGQYWNEYMPGHAIAMPPPLSDGQVEYPKDEAGNPVVPETVDQYSRDVSAFMMWAAEPHLEARKAMGFKVIIFLIVFAALLYFTKKKIWARAHAEEAHG
ncbi:cytochrome c1 [Chelatococcus daeguensis]|uniref:Cytochrome c1 n=2 Tax=Chelatococcus TaxID=28209 RepID=A0AAC9JT83_9HYPH|nr:MULTISPECIES: cytochrome c1 [Chelatococcus]APF38171.1 cytochrome c1 [Chelatococcus daeguensis]KZE27439.1 cytochrome C [Chelatococcus daeguensis]MBM3085655.1 cytochrome c1 [Chelatococcus daeguensis]CUA84337.1 Cytochrome c1 [Chelatococcus sambhunathii]